MTTRKFRVLVVDDTVIFRRLVSDALTADPELEVIGTAANGRIALAKIDQQEPDLVILDVEMPEMDGLETLQAIRKTRPRLPVIMFSALTERGATATLDALGHGATDYFTKPSNLGGLDASMAVLREKLVPEIKLLCRQRLKASAPPLVGAAAAALPPLVAPPRFAAKILAIGASTGGPNALADLLPILPARFPLPVVIVQHMPPVFTRHLAERLSRSCALPVEEAVSGAILDPGKIWVAPGDHHLAVVRDGARRRLLTHQDPPEHSCRPAVDVLFRSVADVFPSGVLGVVLTGMGEDGMRGSEAIQKAGGRVIAQDEATSVVWGMPGAVTRAGLAASVLPLEGIGPEILRYCPPA